MNTICATKLVLTCVAALAVVGCDGRDAESPTPSSDRETATSDDESQDSPRPNVVFWLVDTLRADRTSAYGYARQTTPVLEELAENGVLFEQFHVHNNWTSPSVMSLLTGRLPLTFSVGYRGFLPPELTTAAEWYWEQGYDTSSFTQSVATSKTLGHASGYEFMSYSTDWIHPRSRPTAPPLASEHLVHRFEDWLDGDARDSERPFFAFIHSLDPHIPLHQHEGHESYVDPSYDGIWDGSIKAFTNADKEGIVPSLDDQIFLSDIYDTEVRYSDSQLGALRDSLSARGLLENTLLVIVSDHGEELYDRGSRGHANRNLYAELTHVPLVIHWPEGLDPGIRVPQLTAASDLLPTLLDLCGIEPIPKMDGTSMADLARGTRADSPKEGAEYVFLDRSTKATSGLIGVRVPQFLALRNAGNRRPLSAYYDLVTDPAARTNLIKVDETAGADMALLMDRWSQLREEREAQFLPTKGGDLTPETRERLEELGYLNGGVSSDDGGEDVDGEDEND